MPFILRPAGPFWGLVEVCLVHSIMDVEAVEQWQRGAQYIMEDLELF
jgi:hypothetical protein